MSTAFIISALSTEQLLELSLNITKELQKRCSQPSLNTEPVEEVNRSAKPKGPGAREIRFIRNCLAADYVKADMKNEYRALAVSFPEWFKENGYPTDLRGSDFANWKKYRS